MQQYSHMIDCCIYMYSHVMFAPVSCMNNKPVYTVTRKIVISSCWQVMRCHLHAYLLIFCMYVLFDSGMRWFQTGRLGFKFVSSFAPEFVIVGHRWALRKFKVTWVTIFPCRIFVEYKWMRKLWRSSSNPSATLNLLWSFCLIQQKFAGVQHWGACISMIWFTSTLLNLHKNSSDENIVIRYNKLVPTWDKCEDWSVSPWNASKISRHSAWG